MADTQGRETAVPQVNNAGTLPEILQTVINPALAALEPHGIPPSDEARAMLCAIGLQESMLQFRHQVTQSGIGKGPARGLWQFEAEGGVNGVLRHKKSADMARHFATRHAGSRDSRAVWAALEDNDILACILARLLLWTDPAPLPEASPEAEAAAWDYYLRLWRPGKARPEKWPRNWEAAVDAVRRRCETALDADSEGERT